MKRFARYRLAPVMPALFLVMLWTAFACAQPWSFAVFADNRSEQAGFRRVLNELKSGQPLDLKFPSPRFVAGIGDLDPLEKTVENYNQIIGAGVPFIPVRGNHESPADVQLMLRQVLPAIQFPLKFFEPGSISYYFDCKNIRFIVIDTYTSYGKGLKDRVFLGWIEKAISSADKADHVFIAFHEPSLPLEPAQDPFWSMLLRHSDKVRAVICGHTHVYARRYISGANGGGIHFINAGNAGNARHSDYNLSLFEVSIDGKEVLFRTVQAPLVSGKFAVTDQWPAAGAQLMLNGE